MTHLGRRIYCHILTARQFSPPCGRGACDDEVDPPARTL
jgi:hypothetical protein